MSFPFASFVSTELYCRKARRHLNFLRLRKSSHLVRMVSRRDWAEVDDILLSVLATQDFVNVQKSFSYGCQNYPTLLHFICKLDPPLSTIKMFVKIYPDSVYMQDKKKRLPLHIAASHNADSSVMNYLVEKNPESAFKKDKKKMAALHLLLSQEPSRKKYEISSKMEVIELLLKKAPSIALEEDSYGISPLQYTILNRYSDETISLILTFCSISNQSLSDSFKSISSEDSFIRRNKIESMWETY